MSTYRGSGCSEFDRLLGGGMSPESPDLLEYEPGVGYMVFIANYLNEGLRAGDLVPIVTSDLSYSKLLSELSNLGVNVRGALEREQLIILDVSGMERFSKPTPKSISVSSEPRSVHKVIAEIGDLVRDAEEKLEDSKFSYARCALLSLTSLLLNHIGQPPYKITHNVVSSVLRPRFMFMTAVGRDVLRRNELAAVENLFSGIIELKMIRGKDGRHEKRMRVSSSPVSGFFPHEVSYEVIKNIVVMSPPVCDITSLLTSEFSAEKGGTVQLSDSPRILLNTHELSHFIKYLTNATGYESMSRILYQCAKETVKPMIEKLLSVTRVNPRFVDGAAYQDLVRTSIALMSTRGFGAPESVQFDPSSNEFRVKVRKSAICLYFKDHGKPMNFVVAGALAGMAEVIRNEPFDYIEERCIAKGDDCCEYVVRRSKKQTNRTQSAY
nr:ATPase domain-containing protein [Candidatus Njordarchaeota archaeon]